MPAASARCREDDLGAHWSMPMSPRVRASSEAAERLSGRPAFMPGGRPGGRPAAPGEGEGER